METFGQRLKAAMDRRDVTVRELAKRMDVHEKTVYRWREHSRGPSIADCDRIARALSVPITDLVPDNGSEKRSMLATPEPQSVLAAELAEQLTICGLGCDECLHAGDDVVLDALACAGLKLVRDPGPTASRAFIERAAD